ncbi:hypothetical protein HS088_TW07G00305 [Tripterygium wilfordii]|uniref:Uncharacterized protein n=1 Tax=Tripterygium wilfordii TaxID=458696 RepID=A0A7J7DF87_TRIWF|nr:hypothetical protein HS088_TW07G00305 [Tripterygium wilfordii]
MMALHCKYRYTTFVSLYGEVLTFGCLIGGEMLARWHAVVLKKILHFTLKFDKVSCNSSFKCPLIMQVSMQKVERSVFLPTIDLHCHASHRLLFVLIIYHLSLRD